MLIKLFRHHKIFILQRDMLISFIIPCYNDEHILPQSLATLEDFFRSFDHPYQLIFVDDGSNDSTLHILKAFHKKHPRTTEIIHYPHNRGKGFAVKTWVMQSTGDWFFFMDSDLSTNLSEINSFLAKRKAGTILIGSRISWLAKRTRYKWFLGTLSRIITRRILNTHLHDTQCGFKCFEKKAKQLFQELRCEKFAFDIEDRKSVV